MLHVDEPGGRSWHSLPTSVSQEARAAFTLASVAGTPASATSHVEGVRRSSAALASAHAAEVAPVLPQIFASQAPHGPLAAPLPEGAGAESARSLALA